jgi:uncharacterized membrane protein YphA (DoxX/SURF4 family)
MTTSKVMDYVVLWVRIAFGAHSLLSGLNHFFGFLPLPPIDASPAGAFVAEMTRMGLYDMIKVIECVVGACLLLNLFVPLALLLEFPITISIFHLSVFVDGGPRQLFTGPRELFYNTFLLAAYAGYFLPMLKARAALWPIWQRGVLDQLNRGPRP